VKGKLMDRSDIETSRDKILARIDQEIATAQNADRASCLKMAKGLTIAIFDALDECIQTADGDLSESDELAGFVEVMTPRAMAFAVVSFVSAATPEHFVAEASALLALEFSRFMGDCLQRAAEAEAADASLQ
jgi:hypothetical protein